MTSGWEVYYVIFLSSALALSLPVALSLISSAGKAHRASPSLHRPTRVGEKTNTRYFLGAVLSLPLVVMALILIPCVGVLASRGREGSGLAAFGILSISGLAALAVGYASRKGDLDWLRSFRSPPK